MKKRIVSALIALIIVVPLIILGGWPFYIGIYIVSIIGFNEIIKLTKPKKLPLLIYVMLFGTYLLFINSSISDKVLQIDSAYCILLILFNVFPLLFYKDRKLYSPSDALFYLGVSFLLGIAFKSMIVLRNISLAHFFYVILVAIISDTFGHFVGTKIGKNKLCPLISPNKTIEGMIGATLFGTFIGAVFIVTFIDLNYSLIYAVVISLIISLCSQCGDLIFSAIKRDFNVKDFGNIMPGHGGVLDRLDSIILSSLSLILILSFL